MKPFFRPHKEKVTVLPFTEFLATVKRRFPNYQFKPVNMIDFNEIEKLGAVTALENTAKQLYTDIGLITHQVMCNLEQTDAARNVNIRIAEKLDVINSILARLENIQRSKNG